jgi:hypothetical protein
VRDRLSGEGIPQEGAQLAGETAVRRRGMHEVSDAEDTSLPHTVFPRHGTLGVEVGRCGLHGHDQAAFRTHASVRHPAAGLALGGQPNAASLIQVFEERVRSKGGEAQTAGPRTGELLGAAIVWGERLEAEFGGKPRGVEGGEEAST